MGTIQKKRERGALLPLVRSRNNLTVVVVIGFIVIGLPLLLSRARGRQLPHFFCETHVPPDDAAQHSAEMKDSARLQAKLEASGRCGPDGSCRMSCGGDGGGEVIVLPRRPEGMQLSTQQAAAVWCALRLESKRLGRPANLLVWGLGNDSPFWQRSTEGRVAFVEDNEEWFETMKSRDGGLEQYLVKYDTEIRKDLDRLGTKELASRAGNLLDPIGIWNKRWDVILVDAPMGCSYKDPGRFGPIITSKKVVDTQGHGYIFVDDYQRIAERKSSDVVLDGGADCKDNCGECVAVFNRIHPYSGQYVEKTAMFSFGDSTKNIHVTRQFDGAKQCRIKS